jgi:hypothetical protein
LDTALAQDDKKSSFPRFDLKKKNMSASTIVAPSAAMSALAPGGVDISKLLKSQGPVVSAVLLKAGPDAAVEQVEVDTTPQKQMVQKLLGGPFTFLGQYEEEGIMLMCLRDENSDAAAAGEETAGPTLNQHKLQPPFDDAKVRGDILLLKVANEEEESEGDVDTLAAKSNEEFFLHYTKDSWVKFAARTDVEAPKAVVSEDMEEEEEMESDDQSEEEEENVEGESDEEDEDDGAGFMEMLMGQVVQRFQQEHGRLPDESELQALQSAIAEKMGGM